GGAASFAVYPVLASPWLWAGTRASWLLVHAAEFFARMPGASIELPAIRGALAAMFFAGLFAFALCSGRWRWLGVAAPIAVLWALLAPVVVRPQALDVTFLAVGQGDAIVVSSAGHHALIDGGGIAGGSDVGARIVRPFLHEERISSLDLAVLSHPHPDHALGLISVLPKVPTRELWLGAGAEDGPLLAAVRSAAGDATVKEVEAGSAPFQLGLAKVEVLGPPKDRVLLEGVNDRSVVLRVSFGEVSILLTGDIEAAAEETLETGPVTVMKAPHHGSSTSSSKALLERARPKIVVFCVGRKNRFHFPDEGVIERYREVGAECYRTDSDGAVRILSDGRDVRVVTWHPHEQPADVKDSPAQLAQVDQTPQPWSDDP
ncbi:MAG: ComEC/Rec2 family competence protein, partial [Myxococcaceae bacterium]